METWTSWNKRISHPYAALHRPADEAALAAAVAGARSVRCLGTGRSSADICAGTDALLDLSGLAGGIEIDRAAGTASAPAGAMLSELLVRLQAEGLGIAALPDIDCVSLGGAVATGTHGTGPRALSLSDYLCACRLVAADGSVLELDEGDPRFDAVRVSLGLLGVMSRLSFRVEPIRPLAVTERPCRDAEWLERWPEWLAGHDFLRLLWLPHTGWATLITGDHYDGEPPFAPLAAPAFHARRRAYSARFYAACGRFPGLTPAANRLLRRLFFGATVRKTGSLYDATVTKSRGNTLELAEWTIPFAGFSDCFAELRRRLGRDGNYGHIPMDVRFLRPSRAWLGNSYGADTVTVGCVSRTPELADRHRLFAAMERIFLDHGGRPHWAKRFAAGPAELRRLYPRWDDFAALRRAMDPTGKFLNAWLAERFA